MSRTPRSPLEAALRWAALGWKVFPVHTPVFPGDGGTASCTCSSGAACQRIGKHPRIVNGFKAATADPAQIEAWWTRWPDANIGVATGAASGFVAIDEDPRNGGDDTLRELESKHGKLPHTVEQLTGGGGRHLCFAHPGVYVKSRCGVLPGIDVKADGGYIVVEPSLHKNGHRYAFELSSYPGEVLLAEMPEWLQDLVLGEPGGGAARDTSGSAPAPDGVIPEGQRDDTLTSLAGTMRKRGMIPDAIAAALQVQNQARCRPPLPRDEVEKIARSVGRYAPAADGLTIDPPPFAAKSVRELLRHHPDLRRPVVEGILREGELLNLVSLSKGNKSWLATHLALCVAAGLPWIGRFATTKSRVLILDNELHQETSAYRIPIVTKALGLSLDAIADGIDVDNARGRLLDIPALSEYLSSVPCGRYGLLVLDAFYRFIPKGFDENSNADMTVLYNHLDRLAADIGSAIVLVHHSSKGNQSGKSVTDVGSGAGAQSRATDAHLVLRPHQEEGAVVVEAAVRSWAPVDPFCLRWEFPTWRIDESLDPAAFKTHRKPKTKQDGSTQPKRPDWTPEQFVARYVTEQPQTKDVILDAGSKGVKTKAQAKILLDQALAEGRVHRWGGTSRVPLQYATIPPPGPEARVCVRASPPTPPVGAQAPRGRGKSRTHTHDASGSSETAGTGEA